MVPRRILVATDGSHTAQGAETFAADMAAMMSATGPVEVVVLTVVHDVGHVPEGGGVIPPSLERVEAAKVSEAGAGRIKDLLAGCATGTAVAVQPKVVQALMPGTGIVVEAHATGTCSLIVMGNRGHGGMTEAVLGSVSQQVVHEAHCPVLIVRS